MPLCLNLEAVQDALSIGADIGAESQPDGSWRWLRRELTRIALNPDGSGEIVGYIVNVDDTRKAQQQALSSVHLSSVGKITASLAAELRRPLAAAHIATEILELELASDNTECAEERLALIKDKISYVIRVHDQLQRFARDRGYAHSLRATSIDEVVTRTLDVVAPALHEDRIDPVVNIPPLGCPRVLANAVDLEQVLTCLILNARDAIVVHGPRAFRRVSIGVIPSPTTGTVSIKISDNGGGIPADVMSHLFEPFVTTKKDAGNIGLDLASCNARRCATLSAPSHRTRAAAVASGPLWGRCPLSPPGIAPHASAGASAALVRALINSRSFYTVAE